MADPVRVNNDPLQRLADETSALTAVGATVQPGSIAIEPPMESPTYPVSEE